LYFGVKFFLSPACLSMLSLWHNKEERRSLSSFTLSFWVSNSRYIHFLTYSEHYMSCHARYFDLILRTSMKIVKLSWRMLVYLWCCCYWLNSYVSLSHREKERERERDRRLVKYACHAINQSYHNIEKKEGLFLSCHVLVRLDNSSRIFLS
jgi:hypothetical protein